MVRLMIWSACSIIMLYAADSGLDYNFGHLSVEDGLSQSNIYSILQDEQGFMWFGTADGLNRYDGYEFRTYHHDTDDPESLPGNTIFKIFQDTKQRMWVGTAENGLARYDREREKFTCYRNDPGDSTSLLSNSIWDIVEDKKGRFWVATNGGGLELFEPETGIFHHALRGEGVPFKLKETRVFDLFVDNQDNLWIGTEHGIYFYNFATEFLTHYTTEPADSSGLWIENVIAMAQDGEGRMWFGGNGNGLHRLSKDGRSFEHFGWNFLNPASVNADYIHYIYSDGDSCLWVGTKAGLIQYHTQSGEVDRYIRDRTRANSIGSNDIMTLFRDRSGVLWIGTTENGLSTLVERKNKFKTTVTVQSVDPETSSNQIFSFTEDKEGTLWVGTWDGLYYRKPETDTFILLSHNKDDPGSLTSDLIWDVDCDSLGTVWVCTQYGLNAMTGSTGTFRHFFNDPEDPQSISSNVVYTVTVGKKNEIWIGTDVGLDRYDPVQDRFYHYPLPNLEFDQTVDYIYEDHSGSLWVGTYGGLFKLPANSADFIRYAHIMGDTTALSSNYISYITEDKENNLWVATLEAGINRYDPSTNSFKAYGVRDGLPSDVVNAILPGDAGELWISTNNGLSRFDILKEQFRNYDMSDGVQSNEFNSGAAYIGRNGLYYFGGIKGFNQFIPSEVSNLDNPYIPPVVITGFQLFHESMGLDDNNRYQFKLSKEISQCQQIKLTPEQNVITLQFAALNFIDPEKNQYACKLEGYDKDWNYIGTRRIIDYINLPYGDFTFRVKASNNDGIWNEQGTELQILHETPLFSKPLMRVGSILFVLGLIIMIFQLVNIRIRARNRQLMVVNEALNAQIFEREKAEKALEKYRDELENTVARRTHQLEESKLALQRERDLFIGGQVVIFKWRRQSGSMVEYVSPNIEQVFGYKDAEFLSGKLNYYDIVDERDRDLVKKEIAVAVTEGQHSLTHTPYRVVKKDGTIIWLQDFTTLIRDEKGELDYFLGYVVDITEQINSEKKLREQQAQLIHAGRLASLGEMATGIAHELNQPLSIIRAQAELLSIVEEKKPADQQNRMEDLNLILSEVDRAARIIYNMREFARRQSGKIGSVHIEEPIRKALIFFQQQFTAHGIDLVVDIEKNLPKVSVDPQQFEQVVVNFITNARYAVDKKEEFHSEDYTRRVEIRVRNDSKTHHVVMEVTDNGLGMTDEDMERCFEPFFTRKEVGEGTGLGLSIVHGIVRGFKGSIEVESKVDSGTTFRVFIPYTQTMMG